MPAPSVAAPTRDSSTRRPAATVVIPKPIPAWEFAGKTLYRTVSGKVIELPEGMTALEVATLEAEALAAEKDLGKGPPPKPVPDVRKPAPKPEKPEVPKKKARGRRGAGAKGAAAKAAAAAAALLEAVGKSKVAQFLAGKALPALSKGVAGLAKLKEHQQTHDDAGEKLKKSEDAVVIPPSEGQSKSNAGQVGDVAERPAPVVEEKKGKTTLQESLTANLPKNIEAADNFKRDKKAQHMGADVLNVVQGDKNAVIGTFGAMTQTPPPTPPEETPVELPPVEEAPRTPVMKLGQGSIVPLLKEHTDLGGYTNEADRKLKEEGVTQEQLDMVDSGELADANKEKKGMALKAKTEPLAVQEAAKQEAVQVETSLEQEEKQGRATMQAKRRHELNHTAQKQKGTKSALEKKRDEVAAEINGRYQKAQDSVTKKLDELEKQSMKRFDDGNAAAAKVFEDNVKRDIDAYKADRYSGWFGWARKAKDWLLGMDKLPRVKAIFDANRAEFVATIDRLVEQIAADNKRVIQECKDELAEAKKKIQEYVDGLEPGLKDIGKKAAGEMNEKLAELDKTVAGKEKELQAKLKDKQTAAIKAIDQKIEKMKEAMSGALAKLGKLLLWAAKKFFTWALSKFGMSLGTIESIIDKGVAVLKAIFTGPIKFVKNLVGAAMLGFENFGKNFLVHLGDAVFSWLTGSLEGVKLPSSWSVQGILSVAFQLIGISWQHIKARIIALKLMPQAVVTGLERAFPLVVTLISEGPMAAWEALKDMAGELVTVFKDTVSAWIKRRIIEEAIKTIALAFIPGAGIIRAIIAIYDTIVFFIQKAKQIMEMIGNFLSSISDIAAGNIAAAADALEKGLALGLKLIIAFLAKLIKLDKVTQAIRDTIKKIQARVEPLIDRVATWVVTMAKKAGRFVATKAGEAFSWAFAKTGFSEAGGKRHSIYVEGDEQPRLMIASDPKAAEDFLNWYIKEQGGQPYEDKRSDLVKKIRKQIGAAKKIADEIAGLKKNGAAWKDRQGKLLDANVALSELLSTLVGRDPGIAKEVEKYKLEGLTGTYASMPKPPGDDFTADHQPQAAVLQFAATFSFFSKDGEMKERALGRAKEGYAINLYKKRHELGATYGMKGKVTKESFVKEIKPLIKDRPPGEQRREVIQLIKDATKRDAQAIKDVVRAKYDTATWVDVTKLAGKDKEGQKLVGEIRDRINAGEDQIVNQDFDSLAG